MQSGRIALLAAAIVACEPERAVEIESGARRAPAPAAEDVGRVCHDVGELRACWGEQPGAVHGVRPVARTLPERRAPERGWRCAGQGSERSCEDRALGSSAFVCAGGRCVQRHPRMPDDGEWECADVHGVVVCHGGLAAAGVVPGQPDIGWLCGARRSHPTERVCVDLSPDRPNASSSCRFEAGVRVCSARPEQRVGAACGPCPAGSVCAKGHCLPLEPKPECWLDRDCGSGACLLGTCRGGA